MSLLSENVATVGKAEYVDVSSLTLLTPSIATHFPILSGRYKQLVGYVLPRTEEWNYVLDVNTNEPLQLPNGYLPVAVAISAVQKLPDDISYEWYYIDTPVDPVNGDYFGGSSWNGSDINSNTYYEEDQQVKGLTFEGHNWIVFKNEDYPTPVPYGMMKFVIEYI